MTTEQLTLQDQKRQQSEFWNGEMGSTWVEQQAFIDNMLRPFEVYLVSSIAGFSPNNVLDIGCGNGTTTLSIAEALGENGQCTGIDLSAQMIENAIANSRSKGIEASFVCADVLDHEFKRGKFDFLCSRFGVMFFADPIAAFAKLRSASTDEARLHFVVWRPPEEGDFMTTARHSVATIIDDLPDPEPNAPGPFALGDRDRTRGILETAGWSEIDFEALDLECSFPASELEIFVQKLAPTGIDHSTLDSLMTARIQESVRAAYSKFITGDEVRFNAPCWAISATAAHLTD